MLTYLRYALATFCFAASVGCLALWQHGSIDQGERMWNFPTRSQTLCATTKAGMCYLMLVRIDPRVSAAAEGELRSTQIEYAINIHARVGRQDLGTIGRFAGILYFPLWYPALIFAFAGVAALRLGRRFTIRSAIIATTVVAGLLGMAVIL